MLGKLNELEIEELLKTQFVGRIGCSLEGETYVVPISYAYDGNYIYCHTSEGKKIKMMRKNPKVCFEVDKMVDMGNWQSVIAQGMFEELKRKKEKSEAMEALLNRYLPVISSITTHLGDHWPFHPDNVTEIKGVVFRFAVQQKTGRFELNEESPTIPG